MSISLVPDYVDQLRKRLQKMSEEQLMQLGKAAREVCSGSANRGKPPRITRRV
jgi:hypothetical protein